MEDFLKFLLIAGAVFVGIINEVNKSRKAKKATHKRPDSPMPSPVEVTPDEVPMPEAWGGLLLKQTSKPAARQQRKKEEISVAASLANSAAQDKRNSRQGSHYTSPHISPDESIDNEHDFTIHSAEEARRAIIWGEILQRKY